MMNLRWWRRSGRGGGGAGPGEICEAAMKQEEAEITIPPHFRCPITLDLMKDPVTLSTGVTYDRESIEKWIDAGNKTCPVTKQILPIFFPIPNHSIRKMIQNWCVENTSRGVERIPTPRVPITPQDVCDLRLKMAAATRNGDARRLGELVKKAKNWGLESERNRGCILGNGVGAAMADAFEFFASVSGEANVDLLREILSSLTWAFPFGKEDASQLKSVASLRYIVRFLKEDDLSARQNAVCVLKEVVCDAMFEVEGIEEALVNVIRHPICPKTTKRSLAIVHHMISSSQKSSASRFIESGMIPLIFEILVDGDKIMIEKGLAIMDEILNWEEGKEGVSQNALAIPILVKRMMRVSDAATELCVSSLWKMRSGGNAEEAVQLGAFQKLLLVLQIGCGEGTREKASELLKLMKAYADKLDCYESSLGLIYIKTPH